MNWELIVLVGLIELLVIGLWWWHRPRVVIVAGYNAHKDVKDRADYVCDGIADQIEINAALVEARRQGHGRVQTTGRFYLDGPIVLQSGNHLYSKRRKSRKQWTGNW